MVATDSNAYLAHIVYDEERGGWCLTEEGRWLVIQAMITETKERDRLDVIEGRRTADYTHFIPRSWLRGAKAIFPKKYTPS
jgi:hypothetical protein